jgi:hypothetical protein
MFGFKKKKPQKTENKLLLGMIMLNDVNSFNNHQFLEETKKRKIKMGQMEGNNSTMTFKVGESLVALAHMPIPIPKEDIEGCAKFAYNWEGVMDATKYHQSHLIITVSGYKSQTIELYRLFTMICSALLESSDSLGVYMGEQTLLIPKYDYLEEADHMDADYLPLNLWIYFGLGMNISGNYGYTFGLKGFDKQELEIIDSKRDLDEVRGFLFNMAHYVLDFDVIFKDGQTCGLSAEERISIAELTGVFVEGKTFKLGY